MIFTKYIVRVAAIVVSQHAHAISQGIPNAYVEPVRCWLREAKRDTDPNKGGVQTVDTRVEAIDNPSTDGAAYETKD